MNPTFTSSEPLCPIIDFHIVDADSVSDPTSTMFDYPLTNIVGSDWVSVPADTSLDKDYTFYIVVTALGGAQMISTAKELRVGCTESLIITQSPAWRNSELLDVGNSTFDVYVIVEPITDRYYCPMTET
jgi:hypothetical protein